MAPLPFESTAANVVWALLSLASLVGWAVSFVMCIRESRAFNREMSFIMRKDHPAEKLISCNYCPATLPRGPDVAYSGWVKLGYSEGAGEQRVKYVSHVCPECQREHGLG